jgi:two-component system LytT family response regulator
VYEITKLEDETKNSFLSYFIFPISVRFYYLLNFQGFSFVITKTSHLLSLKRISVVKIRAIIIDDELLARKRVGQLLAKEADCEIIAECANGLEAIAAISEHQPDLIFLDVQMPEINGFQVLQELKDKTRMPAVIFVTAYDQFTLRAFDARAVDYILKPFSVERFQQAFSRARKKLRPETIRESNEQISLLLEHLKLKEKFLDRLIVNHKNRLILVPINDVDWIESYGNYLRIHSQGKIYLLRETMNNLAERLDPKKFLRIHRSTLVNLDRIKEFQPMFGGQYTVVLHEGTELTLSRNYRQQVMQRFET